MSLDELVFHALRVYGPFTDKELVACIAEIRRKDPRSHARGSSLSAISRARRRLAARGLVTPREWIRPGGPRRWAVAKAAEFA